MWKVTQTLQRGNEYKIPALFIYNRHLPASDFYTSPPGSSSPFPVSFKIQFPPSNLICTQVLHTCSLSQLPGCWTFYDFTFSKQPPCFHVFLQAVYSSSSFSSSLSLSFMPSLFTPDHSHLPPFFQPVLSVPYLVSFLLQLPASIAFPRQFQSLVQYSFIPTPALDSLLASF